MTTRVSMCLVLKWHLFLVPALGIERRYGGDSTSVRDMLDPERHESARLSLDTLMVAGSIHPDKKLAEYLSLDTGVAMAIILVTTGPESSGCTV